MFSSFGVWLIESSPINSRDLSDSSYLKTLKVPLGKGTPKPTSRELLNLILFVTWIFFC